MKAPVEIYGDLLSLVVRNPSFEMKEIVKDDIIYRIFNYRIASYQDFMEPSALEARGIMFEVGKSGEFIRIASRPFEKFFNYMENPSTIGLDLSKVKEIWDKADGSMLSTYIHNKYNFSPDVMFKTRKMLDIPQITEANKYANANKDLRDFIIAQTLLNRTVICEWTAPDNRIVLEYKEPKLIILAVRDNETGKYIDLNDILPAQVNSCLCKSWHTYNIPIFLEDKLPKLEGIEGIVAVMESGQRVKFKTEWYQLRHGTIDVVLTPKRLFETLLDEKYDELVSINKDIPYLLEKIEKMYQIVVNNYNQMVFEVENLYKIDKDLDRKSFAIKYSSHPFFGLIMSLYLGKNVDYKKYMMKRWYDEFSKNFTEKEQMEV